MKAEAATIAMALDQWSLDAFCAIGIRSVSGMRTLSGMPVWSGPNDDRRAVHIAAIRSPLRAPEGVVERIVARCPGIGAS